MMLSPITFVKCLEIWFIELFGSTIRLFSIFCVALFVHTSAIYQSGWTVSHTAALLLALGVYQTTYLTALLMPTQSFKIVPTQFNLATFPIFVAKIFGQFLGSVLAAWLTKAVSLGMSMPRPYMKCGTFYHEGEDAFVSLFTLSLLGSCLITLSSLVVNSRSFSRFKKAKFMATAYSLVTLLCYRLGGLTDGIAFIGSNIVNNCWNSNSPNLDSHAILDNVSVSPYVYIIGDLTGIMFGSLIYMVGIEISAKTKKE